MTRTKIEHSKPATSQSFDFAIEFVHFLYDAEHADAYCGRFPRKASLTLRTFTQRLFLDVVITIDEQENMAVDNESPQQPQAAPDLSNFGRLKNQLPENTLAAALLDAWQNGPQDKAKARMLAAVNDHVSKKQTRDETPNSKN